VSRIQNAIDHAIGPEPANALGYLNPTGDPTTGRGYIATMKLSVGTVTIGELDEGTEKIVTYDRCEAGDANISQVNMITASSFCGLDGAVWGLDLARASLPPDPLFHSQDLFTAEKWAAFARDTAIPPVTFYNGAGLLEATERLFGHTTHADRRHPPLPGAHVVCANKSATVRGPGYAFALLGIAIPADREQHACLFIEDTGVIPAKPGTPPPDMPTILAQRRLAVAKSMTLCARNYGDVTYTVAYINAKAVYARHSEVGCALACAPYVLLAQDTVPRAGTKALATMSLPDWEEEIWGKGSHARFSVAPTGKDGIYVQGGPE
jgi:histidine decarboxylase